MTPSTMLKAYMRVVLPGCFVAAASLGPVGAQTLPATESDSLPRIIYQANAAPPEQGHGLVPGVPPAVPQVTVDVFWCSGDTLSASRQLAASELAGSFATLAKAHLIDSVTEIKEVRTRPIDINVFLKPLNSFDRRVAHDEVLLRYDHTDEQLHSIANHLADNALSRIQITKGESEISSPNYISAYVCMDIDPTAISGRLFFQVKNADQKPLANRSADQLREILPGLTVESGIEVVGAKSPKRSEVRFFFPDDQKLATRIADQIFYR